MYRDDPDQKKNNMKSRGELVYSSQKIWQQIHRNIKIVTTTKEEPLTIFFLIIQYHNDTFNRKYSKTDMRDSSTNIRKQKTM